MRVLHTLRSGKGKVWNNFKKIKFEIIWIRQILFYQNKI